MAKVCDLLRLPAFKGMRVLAGKTGLQKKIEHVTVMEVPDIKRWLKGNDFLITCFYSVRKSEKEQCQLIENLADVCSCIAVKTGQYVHEISQAVKDTADRCDLPLLEIPFETSYIDLLMNGMSLIFEEENKSCILEKYVRDIIYDNYTDEILMIERGKLFGFEVEDNYFAAINLCFKKKYTPSEQENKTMRFLCQNLQRYMMDSRILHGCHMNRLEKGFLLLVEGESKKKIEDFLERNIREEYLRGFWIGTDMPVVCGIGPVKSGLKGIRDSYSLSFKAIKIGSTFAKKQLVYFYNKLRTFCELEKILATGSKDVFIDILSAVKNQELLDTLFMYYECNANIDEISLRMFTHRNTTKYRLNRIQELTGLELKNPEDNFKLYLAILAMKLNSK